MKKKLNLSYNQQFKIYTVESVVNTIDFVPGQDIDKVRVKELIELGLYEISIVKHRSKI